MKGQSLGPYQGSNQGHLILNIDDRGNHFAGTAYLLEANIAQPCISAVIETPDKSPSFKLKISDLATIDRDTGTILYWDTVKAKFEGVAFPTHADVTGQWTDKEVILNWKTDIGTFGTCTATRSRGWDPSELTPLERVQDWESFKSYVDSLDHRRYIFRGQSDKWRLRTRFHRLRTDLARFLREDHAALNMELSGLTRHRYNLNIADENGAFLNLVQHHGYPTPLLDWTYSPYVAAFFAFRGLSASDLSSKESSSKRVRIYIFDLQEWERRFRQYSSLVMPKLHLSVARFLTIDNQRAGPQQSVSTATNVDDLETYIRSQERLSGNAYLQAVDLPWSEKRKTMRQLSTMGITAASQFPGLDGACEELRERFFEEPLG
jgi:hypothetical protein